MICVEDNSLTYGITAAKDKRKGGGVNSISIISTARGKRSLLGLGLGKLQLYVGASTSNTAAGQSQRATETAK